MKSSTRYVSAALAVAALACGTAGCKKVDEKSSNTMDSASSGVMSNTLKLPVKAP